MHRSQIARIESLLGVTFPTAYRLFIESVPTEEAVWIWEGPVYLELIIDLNYLAVLNLQLRQQGRAFTGECWPEKYLALGGDGCGNTYCVDAGDDPSPALLMFDHDPEDRFVVVTPSFRDLAARLMRRKPTAKIGIPKSNSGSPGVVVTRAPEAWMSVMHPIRFGEWTGYAEDDAEVRLLNYREITNPFTGEVKRHKQPGYAIWSPSPGRTIPIAYRFGCLILDGISKEQIEKARRIAGALGARVVLDTGDND